MKKSKILSSLIDVHNNMTLGNSDKVYEDLMSLIRKLIIDEHEKHYGDILREREERLTCEKFEWLESGENREIMVEAWYTKKIAEIQLKLGM